MMQSKLPKTGTTIFSVMTALANEVGAVNVSQGFPDYAVDPELCALLFEATSSGLNQYAPMAGLPVLREQVARKYDVMHNCSVEADAEITITPGATAALYTAIACMVGTGDEVIIMDPSYDSYAPAVLANGGIVRVSPLQFGSFTPNWDHVRSLINQRTRCIIVNSPHNPCGSTMSYEDVCELAVIADEYNLVVISDEVYELITFDDIRHHTVLSHPGLRNRSFVITSFGKTFHITGWKIGVCVAAPGLTSVFRSVHQYLSFCVNTPAQYALARYMETESRYKGLSSFFRGKRDYIREHLTPSKWTLRPCNGSYFQLLGYEHISDEHDVDFAKRVTREYGVATIPLSPFYHSTDAHSDRVVRVCFAKTHETLSTAVERLLLVS